MEIFKEMNVVKMPTGEEISIEDFAKLAYDGAEITIYKNDKYQVIKRAFTPNNSKKEKTNLVWLSIKAISKEPIHDWREFQEIKNQLVGNECEGLELYPAESRKVDAANQYHLWCFDNPKYRIPFGFDERFVGNTADAEAMGAKQRGEDE